MNRTSGPSLSICALLAACGASRAAEPHSEDLATRAAVAFIRGDTYGDASITIASELSDGQLIAQGRSACGKITSPVWAFRFQTSLQQQRIDGWLHIDATTGHVSCSSIPFLRVGG